MSCCLPENIIITVLVSVTSVVFDAATAHSHLEEFVTQYMVLAYLYFFQRVLDTVLISAPLTPPSANTQWRPKYLMIIFSGKQDTRQVHQPAVDESRTRCCDGIRGVQFQLGRGSSWGCLQPPELTSQDCEFSASLAGRQNVLSPEGACQ